MRILPKKTFESITKDLNKTVTNLESLAQENAIEAGELAVVIQEHQATIKNLDTEGNRAESVATKIKALLS